MAVNVLKVNTSKFRLIPHTSEDFEVDKYYSTLANGKRHHFTDTELRTVHGMLQRWGTGGLKAATTLENFNRFYYVFPDMEMPNDLKSYVFFTRPEMNLLTQNSGKTFYISDDNKTDAQLQYTAAMNPEILYMLTEDFSSKHDFIPYLQSRAESLQIPDYEIRTSDFTVPFYSYKFTYPTVTNESVTGGTFDVTFREDDDLRITKLFRFWIYYMDAVAKNKMKPTREHILDNAYDFMTSVYEIVTDPTSEKILFWAKYTGCFPTSVPLSNFSHNLHSTVDNKVSVQFSYMKVEAMEPAVITDFNNNSSNQDSSFEDVYDTTYGVTGESLVGNPRIVLASNEHGLLLKWNGRTTGKISSISSSIPTLSNISADLASASELTQTFQTLNTTLASSLRDGLTSYMKYNSDSTR